jgi:2-oxoglutarate dehydrogenase E2 component (dihydrolipoamide succinyltransferase)
MADIKIPTVGESISTALISAWQKQDGDNVAAGDVLLTLETDKVSTELTAESPGVLHIKVQAGEEVPVGTVVGSIEADGARPTTTSSESSAAEMKAGDQKPKSTTPADLKGSQTKGDDIASKQKKPAKIEKEDGAATRLESTEPADAAAASRPPERRPAGDDWRAGPAFKVLPRAEPQAAAAAGEDRTTRRRMSPMRRKIAAQLVNAQQTAAMLTTFNEADMSAVIKLRKELQESFTTKHGIKLGFMPFFVKAVVEGLRAVPAVNSRIEGDDIIEHHYYDIGVAVSTERGLMVPVVRDCERKSFAEIERGIADVATRARDGKVQIEELQGGIFTITNGGIFGSLLSTPILNPPQSGILGMHAIQERPVVRDGQVVSRPMMYLALSYDHRVVDGREAVTFLVRVKECLENPARLLLGA